MTATIPFHQGTVTLPESFTAKFGLKGEGEIVVEDTPQGILLKPKESQAVRNYTDDEVAAFEAGDRELERHRGWLEAELANAPKNPARWG